MSPLEPGLPPAAVPEPPSTAPPEPHGEPAVFEALARFVTAAAALAFVEQVTQAAQSDDVPCFRDSAGQSWWIRARGPLGPLREMAGLGAAELYVQTGRGYVRDRGWGDTPGTGPVVQLPALAEVPLLELVRTAGLHPVPDSPPSEACVLLPGYLVPGLLERALELGLTATYQQARLDPLFGAESAARFCYAVRLAAGTAQRGQALPLALLSALRDDPFALVGRIIDSELIIAYGAASPLSDRALARMAAAGADGTWLLAAPPDGCARVTWVGEALGAANLVRLGPAHALADMADTLAYTAADGQPVIPEPRPLRLVTAAGRGSRPVDAVLLDDADLASLPLLLAGEPLADTAFLVRGTADRHLLSAPGGLLTELGLGEPLTCIGPGGIYLPAGYALDPPLGPAARAALFEPSDSVAQVMLRDARLSFDLDTGEPVWRLWAGPLPVLDPQLPRSALADLEEAALELDGTAPPATRRRSTLNRPFRRPADGEQEATAWRDQAYQAERNRDYVTAAQLYARHNEPLRAARMWEREAEESY